MGWETLMSLLGRDHEKGCIGRICDAVGSIGVSGVSTGEVQMLDLVGCFRWSGLSVDRFLLSGLPFS